MHYRESNASIGEIEVVAEMVHDLGLSPRSAHSVSSDAQMSECGLLVEINVFFVFSTKNKHMRDKNRHRVP